MPVTPDSAAVDVELNTTPLFARGFSDEGRVWRFSD